METVTSQSYAENIVLQLDSSVQHFQTVSGRAECSPETVELNPELIQNIISAVRSADGTTGLSGNEQFIIQMPDSADSARIVTVVEAGGQLLAIKEEDEEKPQQNQNASQRCQREARTERSLLRGRKADALKDVGIPCSSFLVDIGRHGDRWTLLQKLHRFRSHEEVAGHLLDLYDRTHGSAAPAIPAVERARPTRDVASFVTKVKTEEGSRNNSAKPDAEVTGLGEHDECAVPALSANEGKREKDISESLMMKDEEKPKGNAETKCRKRVGKPRTKRKPYFLKEYVIVPDKKPKRPRKSGQSISSDEKEQLVDNQRVLEPILEQIVEDFSPALHASQLTLPEDEGYLVTRHTKDRKGHLYFGKDRKFKCAKCSEMIKVTSLRQHYVTLHSEGKGRTREDDSATETCAYCQLSYEPFLARLHEFCAPSTCTWPGCNKQLISRKIYNSHYIRHKTAAIVCDICGQCVKGERDMRRHHKRVHGKERFQCPECTKSFKQQAYLDVHMRKHTGAKPYICFHCGASFAQKASWNWHMKSKHPTDTSWQSTKVFS